MSDMGICQNGPCENPATVVNQGNRCCYCSECEYRICLAIDSLREDYRVNMEKYGDKAGTIDRREYWGRENK